MTRKAWLLSIVAAAGALLLVLCLAYWAPSDGDHRVPTPAPTITVSDDAADRLASKLLAIERTEGDFHLELTEQEATSYLAIRLAGTVPLSSPQIRFLPSQVIVEGDLTGPLRVHVALSCTLRVANNRPQLSIQQGRIANLNVPPFLLDSLSDSITQMLSETQPAIETQGINITSGRLSITGRRRYR